MSYKLVALGDVCTIINGGTPKSEVKEYWDGDLNWITPKEMGKLKEREISFTERKITDKGLKNSSAKLLPVKSVILSSRAPIGHLAINTTPMATNQGCKGLVPSEVLNYEYLYYFLKHSKQLLNDLGSGATFKELSGSKLGTVEIPLPPLATQQTIVAKLDAIFAEIDKAVLATEANVRNSEALFKSYLTEAFDFSENDLVKLSSITTDITDGDHQPPPKATEGVPFITISNVDKETRLIDFSQTFKVSREYFESLKENRKPKNGDVLYTVTGSFGIPIHVNDDFEFCFQRHIGLLRPSENVSSKWLYWLMLSPQIFQQAKNSATGAAQLTVSLKAIRNFMVPSISRDEQLKVVKHLDECFSIYTNLRNAYLKKINAINASKNSFLKQAFHGELVKD